jgi:hypothetical protein
MNLNTSVLHMGYIPLVNDTFSSNDSCESRSSTSMSGMVPDSIAIEPIVIKLRGEEKKDVDGTNQSLAEL